MKYRCLACSREWDKSEITPQKTCGDWCCQGRVVPTEFLAAINPKEPKPEPCVPSGKLLPVSADVWSKLYGVMKASGNYTESNWLKIGERMIRHHGSEVTYINMNLHLVAVYLPNLGLMEILTGTQNHFWMDMENLGINVLYLFEVAVTDNTEQVKFGCVAKNTTDVKKFLKKYFTDRQRPDIAETVESLEPVIVQHNCHLNEGWIASD